jgi:hypothetical protein
MTKKHTLGFKPAAQLEQVGYQHSKRAVSRKHRYQ